MRRCVRGPAETWAGRAAVLVLVGMMGCTRTPDWGATRVALDSRHGALVIGGVPPTELGLPGNISLARFDRRDNEDELYLAGSFSGTVDFGLGTETSAGSGFRSVDAYLLKLDPEADAHGNTPEQARPQAP